MLYLFSIDRLWDIAGSYMTITTPTYFELKYLNSGCTSSFLSAFLSVIFPLFSTVTLGQERFGNMTRVYYKEAVGAFIVFDVTRSATFDAVIKWKLDLDSKVQLPNGSSIPCILIANKVIESIQFNENLQFVFVFGFDIIKLKMLLIMCVLFLFRVQFNK